MALDVTNQNQTEHTYKFSWGYFFIGLLCIICSLIAFYDPSANLQAFAIVFAALAILNGLWLLFTPFRTGLGIAVGILDIIIGIFMLFNIGFAIHICHLVYYRFHLPPGQPALCKAFGNRLLLVLSHYQCFGRNCRHTAVVPAVNGGAYLLFPGWFLPYAGRR